MNSALVAVIEKPHACFNTCFSQWIAGLIYVWLLSSATCGIAVAADDKSQTATLTVATFRADVTPSLGDAARVGFMPKIESIENPLELRGVVLKSQDDVFVLAAIDYCGVCNASYDRLCKAIAAAAETTPERVVVQSLHQHSAPALDADSAELSALPQEERRPKSDGAI